MKIFLKYFVISLIALFLIPWALQKNDFFVVNKPVHSKKLLIEGWLPFSNFDDPPFSFKNFDTIFITGLSNDIYWQKLKNFKGSQENKRKSPIFMSGRGFLFLKESRLKDLPDSIFHISVIAKGTIAEGEFPRLFFLVKDSIIGLSTTNNKVDTLNLDVKINKQQLSLFNLYFDNDVCTDQEDRNIFIYKIIINNVSFKPEAGDLINIPYRESFRSHASNSAMLKSYLEWSGKASVKILIADTLFLKRNKTLATARRFSNFLKEKKANINSLNIYTTGLHSRRTYLSYTKALGSHVKIGIISTKNPEYLPVEEKRFFYNYIQACEELLSWFITLFS